MAFPALSFVQTRMDRLEPIVLAVLVGTLHLVTELPLPAADLRICVADLVLPLALLPVVRRWWPTPGSVLPSVVVWWFVAATLWLTLSLAIGGMAMGAVSRWGLVNKYAGWFLLIGYFLGGTYLGSWVSRATLDTALKAFFVVAAASCLWSILIYQLTSLHLIVMVSEVAADSVSKSVGMVYGGTRMSGFLANPNAFGFMISAVILIQLPLMARGRIFQPPTHVGLLALFGFAAIYSGGRAAVGGLAVGLVALALLREIPWRPAAKAAVGALAIMALMHLIPLLLLPIIDSHWSHLNRLQIDVLIPNVNNEYSIHDRLVAYGRAWELWLQSPILGVGLGRFLVAEVARGIASPQVIHSTWLWLLTELGVVGLVIFASFFAAVLAILWRAAKRSRDPLVSAMIAVLLLFGAMSTLHEIMYQRQLWLFLGAALALALAPPVAERPQ